MLETLRAYGAGLLAGAGEDSGVAAALAGYALRVVDEATAGLQTSGGEVAAARLLDAEDATMRQVLGWAGQHDPAGALRLTVALAPWWLLRGRLAGEYPLLCQAAGRVAAGGQAWCAAQFWLGEMALYSGDLAGALGHLTALRDAIADRTPSQALADCLAVRSVTLSNLGRLAEAADDGHRALALARELGYPAGEAMALYDLAVAARHAGDRRGAVRLARQAQQIPADIPGWRARECSSTLTTVLTVAGDLAAAEGICAAGLARSREAGDLENLADLLTAMADLDLRAGRIGDAAAHLRESVQITARTGGWLELLGALDCCGHLCAATGRCAEAVTVWAACAALIRHEGSLDVRLGRAIDDVSTAVGGLPLLSQDRVWNRVRSVGLDELLQFDWTMVGESAAAAAVAACGVLDEIDIGAAEERIKRLREAIGDRCRYLEILA